MKIKVVFDDWRERGGNSVYQTEKGMDLSAGQFHSGTTFEGSIELNPDDEKELADAMADGYAPAFYVIPAERAARKA
jgi:hypothetical protein